LDNLIVGKKSALAAKGSQSGLAACMYIGQLDWV
jgi:hypothetical protein